MEDHLQPLGRVVLHASAEWDIEPDAATGVRLRPPQRVKRRQKLKSQGKNSRRQTILKSVTPAAQRFIEALVWEGLQRDEAAGLVGKSERWSYAVLSSPATLAHYRKELDVRRRNERVRNFQRLIELRDQDRNLAAAVAAIKVLEQEMGGSASASALGEGVLNGIGARHARPSDGATVITGRSLMPLPDDGAGAASAVLLLDTDQDGEATCR